jgi:AcrR family transcriptional regulator
MERNDIRQSGRPRDTSIDERVLGLTLAELAKYGVSGFSLARVARAAGVARNSIYLRWPNPDDLIVDALVRSTDWSPVVDQGSYPDDLRLLEERLVEVVEGPVSRFQLRFLTDPADSPAILDLYRQRVVDRGFEEGRQVFVRAHGRGELQAGLDPAYLYTAFMGALFMSSISNPGGLLSPDERERQLQQFLLMTAARD